MAMRKKDETVVFPNVAGIDVGAASHWVAMPRERDAEPVPEFGAMTDDLRALGDWLVACGIDTVALESTGVYWAPLYEVLERRGLTVLGPGPLRNRTGGRRDRKRPPRIEHGILLRT